MANLDASDLDALIAVFDGAEREAANRTYPLVKEHAEALRDQWRENARASSGRHGKHYPKSITTEQVPAADVAEWTVGPESARPQGGMGPGFEYGSRNQPPHLDGWQASVGQEPKFLKSLDDLAKDLL